MLTGSLLQLLRRRAGLIILTTGIALGIAMMALTLLLPVAYAATSTVRVGTIVPPGSSGASYDLYYSDRLVNTYSRLLASRPVIEQMRERVARDTNQQLPAHPKITVELPPNTELVILTVRAATPELAAAAANALGTAFIDDQRTWASEQAPAPAVRAEVVEEARPSTATRVPSWILTLGLAGVLGLAAGFAVVLALQRIRPALLTPDAVGDATGLPVLGHLDGRAPDRQDALLLRIALQLGRTEPPLVLVTGADGSDTVSQVVVGLGRAAAQANREVLLIDTDFDQPRLHRALGLSNDLGIGSIATGELGATTAPHQIPPSTTIAVGRAPIPPATPNDAVCAGCTYTASVVTSELIRKSEVPGVRLLAAGPRPPDPVEFLASSACRDVVNHLARQYDLVLLAGPGVLHGITASILALQAEEAVLVVREGAGRAEAQEAAKQLSAFPLRVAGVVVCRRVRRGQWKGDGS
jgi:Mrp family chromosome partitioning ATPase/capsular polysaccharide biosynthesis protein